MRYITLIIALLLLSSRVMAQNDYGKVWVSGGGVSFTTTFNGSSVVNKLLDTMYSPYFADGHSNICDSLGNLILCSDGYNIYDHNVNLLQNGDSMVPRALIKRDVWSGYMQSSIFLPVGNDKYYFITPTASDQEVNTYWNNPSLGRALFDELYYSIVDMRANGGSGRVARKMARLLANVTLSKTQMMACRHADGRAWWLLKQASDTNMVYKFLFTKDSVYGPFIQGFAEPHFTKWDICGQASFSKDGTRYATTIQGAGKVFLADFDRCSGNLSNPKVYEVPLLNRHNPYDTTLVDDATNGVAFSPNGRFLYVNGFYNVQQLDLQAANPAASWTVISGLDTAWDYFNQYSNIYPGPDEKLYVGNWHGLSGQMSVINNPDGRGNASGFCPRCLRFPPYNYGTTRVNSAVTNPPCMPNYRLGKAASLCWPAAVPETSAKNEFRLFPNPANVSLSIAYSQGGVLELADVLGRVLKTVVLPEGARQQQADISSLAPGIYLYRHLQQGRLLDAGKITIVQ